MATTMIGHLCVCVWEGVCVCVGGCVCVCGSVLSG